MRPIWIIQSNLTSESHLWDRALWENKSSFRHIEIIPFSDDLPDVDVDSGTPVICHGSTTLIKNAHKKDWKPGIFFNPYNFEPSTWCDAYGRHFLNWNSDKFMHLKDLDIPEGEWRFVRPNGDFKDFSGSVVDKAGWDKFKKSVQEGGYPFTDELVIMATQVRNIFEEYRCFVVDGKVVSVSKYRLRSILDKKPGAPEDVLSFAQKMANIWSPEKAYVMDVCKMDEGNLHIVELNCFNCSGVYAAPMLPIIQAVEKLDFDAEWNPFRVESF